MTQIHLKIHVNLTQSVNYVKLTHDIINKNKELIFVYSE